MGSGLVFLEAVTLSSILTDIGSIITSAVGWVGSFISEITSEPLLLLAVLLPFVGLGIGLLKRLISTRA